MESELSIRWFRLKIPRKRCLTVTHSGRLFSDLQEIYCLENKHVHQKEKDEKMETAKSKFGRSITLTLINIFHKSCPICVEYKKKKKEMVAVKKENEVNEVNRLKEELMEKKKEVEKEVSEVESQTKTSGNGGRSGSTKSTT